MSANNFVYIEEKKDKIKVSMRDVETGYDLGEVIYTKTLREAIEEANKILQEEIVEYGLHVKLLKGWRCGKCDQTEGEEMPEHGVRCPKR